MAKVVCPELNLESIPGMLQRWRHQAGIVNQDIEPVVFLTEGFGKPADGIQIRQIQLHQHQISVWMLGTYIGHGRLSF